MAKTRSLGSRALVQLLPRKTIDPVALVVAVFDIIGRCYQTRQFRLKPGQQEFEIVQHAALYALTRADSLNRFYFWDEMEVRSKIRALAPEPKRRERCEQIKEARARLRDEAATAQDLLHALDTVDEAFRSMHILFSDGRMPDGFEGVTDTERYMCSAVLGPVVSQLNRIWLRLRAKIVEADGQRPTRRGSRAA
jgi:hypothetical protein